MSAPSRTPIDLVGYGLAVAAAILFSAKGIFIKLAYIEGVPTETVLALRMLFAMPFFVAIGLFSLWRDPALRARLGLRRVLTVAAVGALGYYVSSWLDFAGLNYVSAQYARLVLFTYPFISFALGVWLFKDMAFKGAVPALLLSYFGLVVQFVWTLGVDPDGIWIGTGLILCAAFTYALYLHLARAQMDHVGPRIFTCIGMGFAGVLAIGHNWVMHGAEQFAGLSPTVWLYGLGLGLLCTVAPGFLLNVAISRIGARTVATTGSYGPVATIVLAVFVLGEVFTPWHALGAAMVIGGSVLFSRAEARARAARAAGAD
ncbi:DMT family transporter [Arsenicitalea aurantiaca]|uniref:DMT family transporter n=1 Tax=Arsenicitalea aurantiaca TaxID=1783274 RepID=A0A433X5H6_9HYPH|nr:DMT family transporter [Arsenicitalea aurantiaca]RUT29304.1 DMT family transporter [Arsenicitalea aurantiaca]